MYLFWVVEMVTCNISTLWLKHTEHNHVVPHQDAQRGGPDVPVDLLHPLVADGTRGDDEGGTGGDGLHGHQAVGAVERGGFKAFLFVVDAVGVLPQLAVHTLDPSLVVNDAQFTTDTLEAIVRGVERDNGCSGGGFWLLRGIKQRSILRWIIHSGHIWVICPILRCRRIQHVT